MIDAQQITALLPQALTSLLVLLVMAAITIRRCHDTVATITFAGLLGTLASLPVAAGVIPQAVTGLFVVDGMAIFFSALVLVAAAAATLLMHNYLDADDVNREEMYLLLAISVNGALVLVTARHLASFFIGLELMSIPMYGMAGYYFMRRRSLEAGTKYLVLSAAATSILLFGMAFLYAQTGRLDFAGIATAFASGHAADAWLAQAGLALVLVGIAFKLSLAPFHAWTLDVYEGAPAPVGAFLATVGKVAVVAVLLRLLQSSGVYGNAGSQLALPGNALLGTIGLLAALSILTGNLLALRQQSLKRILAASSIAHFGYLLVAVVAGGSFSIEAAGMYAVAYVVTTIGTFGVVSAVSRASAGTDSDSLDAIRGLARRSPLAGVAMALCVLSLAGMPLTAGFLGKFYIVTAGAAAGLWFLLGLVVVGSAIGLVYYLRVLNAVFAAPDTATTTPAPGRLALIAVTLALLATLLVGVFPEALATALQHATIAQLP